MRRAGRFRAARYAGMFGDCPLHLRSVVTGGPYRLADGASLVFRGTLRELGAALPSSATGGTWARYASDWISA